MEPVDLSELSLDPLADDLRVWQRRRGHRSATDDFLAAHCASLANPEAAEVLDLGCGHGTVSLLLSRVLTARVHLVEAQAISADLAQRNLVENDLTDRARVEQADLRDLRVEARYDLVTGTPPFMPVGSGILPKDPQRAAGRFELRGGIEAYVACAAKALAPGGRVSMLMDGAQDARVQQAFAAVGLTIRSVFRVRPRPDRRPRFAGYVGALTPGPTVEVDLVVRDESGAYTPAMQAIRVRFGAQQT